MSISALDQRDELEYRVRTAAIAALKSPMETTRKLNCDICGAWIGYISAPLDQEVYFYCGDCK